MSVELDPPTQLSFRRPLTALVKEILHVHNTSSHPVAFKVKTTAPKQYCVRPNSGRIESNSEVEVQVLLQAMKEDPPLDFKCKDKFLVLSVDIKPEWNHMQLQELWTAAEEESKENIKEKKVKCVYLPPVGYDSGESTPKNSNSPPQGYLSVPGTTRTLPSQLTNRSSLNGLNDTFHASAEEQPRFGSSPADKRLDEGPSSRYSSQSNVTPVPSTSSSRPGSTSLAAVPSKEGTSPSKPVSGDAAKVEKDLATAHGTIARLETLLDQYKKDLARSEEEQANLRQRISTSSSPAADRSLNKRLSTAEKAASMVSPHDAVHQVISSMKYPPPVEGYPPVVVAVVAFVVFFFTWLLF